MARGGHRLAAVSRNGVPRLDDETLTLPAQPLVSVVIPALNEERYITGLLDSLARQNYGAECIEVLVADGGSSDRTRDLVMNYRGPFAKLMLVDNPKRRATAGLNAGMRVARGDCWIIIGAHSEVREDFVRASVEALKRTQAACVGGPIETVGRSETGKAIAAAMSSPFGVGDAKFRYSEREQDVDTVAFGCYHRRVWEVVGEFDEYVDGGDDDEYNARVREAGGRFVLVPTIRSRYYARETLTALAKQYWEYGNAKGLQLRHGYSLRPRHFVPGMMVAGGPSLLLVGARSKLARRALTVLASAYVVLGGRAAWRASRKNGANPLLTFVAMGTMHASYGAGFLWAAWRER
jgi:succinoglycan biosynthesis protein ExoA